MPITKVSASMTEGLVKDDLSNLNADAARAAISAAKDDLSNVDPATGRAALQAAAASSLPSLPISIANGGTGANNAATAAANLGVVKTDHGALSVGSIAMVFHTTNSTDIVAGTTYSGSVLKPFVFYFDTVGATFQHLTTQAVLSGTWRALYSCDVPANSRAFFLAQRIA